MSLKTATVLAGITIGLLVIYGADVAFIEATGNPDGFLPIDHAARGFGLGLPSMILPFVAYFVARKTPSAGLGGMIIAAGIMIIVGGAFMLGSPADPDSGRSAISEAAPLLVVGSAQAALGALKIRGSRR